MYKFGEKEEMEDPNGNTIFEESKKKKKYMILKLIKEFE